jgi:hypothetical protein
MISRRASHAAGAEDDRVVRVQCHCRLVSSYGELDSNIAYGNPRGFFSRFIAQSTRLCVTNIEFLLSQQPSGNPKVVRQRARAGNLIAGT